MSPIVYCDPDLNNPSDNTRAYLKCSVCGMLCAGGQLCGGCGVRFCILHACEAMHTKYVPYCSDLKLRPLHPGIVSEISHLKYRCPNTVLGCTETMSEITHNKHMSECKYVKRPCQDCKEPVVEGTGHECMPMTVRLLKEKVDTLTAELNQYKTHALSTPTNKRQRTFESIMPLTPASNSSLFEDYKFPSTTTSLVRQPSDDLIPSDQDTPVTVKEWESFVRNWVKNYKGRESLSILKTWELARMIKTSTGVEIPTIPRDPHCNHIIQAGLNKYGKETATPYYACKGRIRVR